jgi:hypothetical protein
MIAVDTNILVFIQNIKNAFNRFWGDGRFPPISEIKEPTIEDVFGICCGPRLLSKALKLHGEDLSGGCLEDRSQDKDPKRP